MGLERPIRETAVSERLPQHAQIVIIGGGSVGCSVAYHLTRLGRRDVALLEQGRLSSGTTWHAAGLVGKLSPHTHMRQLIHHGTTPFSALGAADGLDTGRQRRSAHPPTR